MRLIEKAGGLFDHILRGMFVLGGIMLAFTALSTTTDVVARYVFNRPSVWVSEINGYTLVYMAFLSAAWLQKKGKHISMDTLASRLSPKGRFVLNIILASVSVLLWLTITWYSGQITWIQYQQGWHIFSVLNPIKAVIMGIIPVGSFFLLIELIRETVRLLMRRGEALPEKSEAG